MPPKLRRDGEGAKEQELKGLKLRFRDLSRRYQSVEKERQWLSYSASAKEEQQSSMVNAIHDTCDEFDAVMDSLQATQSRHCRALESEREMLMAKKKEFEVALADATVLEEENERLRDRVYELQDALESQEEELSSRLSLLKTRAFRNRRAVLCVQRETLAELDSDTMSRTFEQMEEEARGAQKAKADLERQVLENGRVATLLCKKQEYRHHELRRLRMYREALEEATTLQEKRISALEKGEFTLNGRLAGMQNELRGLCRRLNEAKAQKEEQGVLTRQLKALQSRWKQAEFDCSHYRHAAITSLKAAMQQVRNRVLENQLRSRSASAAKRQDVALMPQVAQRLADRCISSAPGGHRKAAVLGLPPPRLLLVRASFSRNHRHRRSIQSAPHVHRHTRQDTLGGDFVKMDAPLHRGTPSRTGTRAQDGVRMCGDTEAKAESWLTARGGSGFESVSVCVGGGERVPDTKHTRTSSRAAATPGGGSCGRSIKIDVRRVCDNGDRSDDDDTCEQIWHARYSGRSDATSVVVY